MQYKLRMTKKKFIFLLTIILFSISIAKTSEEKTSNPDTLYLSFESSLSYGHYVYVHQIADENYEIRWEFSGSNINIGINVYAMTDLEFSKFQNYQSCSVYKLSDGSYSRDSGTFNPRSNDSWYVVFLNADSDMQITYLTYNVDFIEVPLLSGGIIGLIIAVLAVGGIIGAFVAVSKKIAKEKPHKQEVSQKIISSSDQYQKELIENAQSVKFCTYCGITHRIDAVYCYSCGRKF